MQQWLLHGQHISRPRQCCPSHSGPAGMAKLSSSCGIQEPPTSVVVVAHVCHMLPVHMPEVDASVGLHSQHIPAQPSSLRMWWLSDDPRQHGTPSNAMRRCGSKTCTPLTATERTPAPNPCASNFELGVQFCIIDIDSASTAISSTRLCPLCKDLVQLLLGLLLKFHQPLASIASLQTRQSCQQALRALAALVPRA